MRDLDQLQYDGGVVVQQYIPRPLTIDGYKLVRRGAMDTEAMRIKDSMDNRVKERKERKREQTEGNRAERDRGRRERENKTTRDRKF